MVILIGNFSKDIDHQLVASDLHSRILPAVALLGSLMNADHSVTTIIFDSNNSCSHYIVSVYYMIFSRSVYNGV